MAQTRWNPQKRRLEYLDDQGQLLFAWVQPGGDASDLPAQNVGELGDDLGQLFTQAEQNEATYAVGETPAQITQRANQANTATSLRNSAEEIAARERALRAEIAQYGADPNRFFAQEQPFAVSGPASPRVTGRPSVAMQGALDAENEAAARMELQRQAELLQAAQEAWAAAKTGIERMQAQQKVQQGLDQSRKTIGLSQQQLSADPKNDKFTYIIDPATGNPRAVHAALAGAYEDQFALEKARRDLLMQVQPEQALAERRAELAPFKSSLAPHVRASWFDDQDTAEFRQDAQAFNPVPRFQWGGTAGTGTAQWGTGTAPLPDQHQQQVQFRSAVEQGQEQRAEGYEVGQALAEIQQERARLEQQFAIERQRIAQERAQADQQYSIQLAQLQERRAQMLGENPYVSGFLG